jgi:UDP-glucose 4-epimerase
MVLPTFVRQALRNEPMTVHGDGRQSRCFGYVLDAVEALVRVAKSSRTVGEIVNIGNDREISIADLAKLVRARVHSRSEIVNVPYEQVYGPGFEDMFRRVPSLVKLERLIGYRPITPLAAVVDAVASEMHSHAFVDSLDQLSEQLAEPVPEPA